MIEMGKMQELTVARRVDFGFYLKDEADPSGPIADVLLPAAESPEGLSAGDRVLVFVYRDSEDRPVAAAKRPSVCAGEAGVVTVREVTKIGAFCDWGLKKDLFLPYREMTERPVAGQELLVRAYVDKSGRMAASMKGIYPLLSTQSPYAAGDEVRGRIYEFGHDFGTFVAVDDRFSAMIPRHEGRSGLFLGDVITARVRNVKKDGKLDLTLRDPSWNQIDEDAEAVLELIEAYAGVLPFTEKASSEVILRETGLSKAAFKRAVGRLYRDRKIDLSDGRIRAVQK